MKHSKTKKAKKQSRKKQTLSKLDEHLVALVLFFSAIIILIIFALYAAPTGYAIAASGTPTPQGVLDMLNQNTFTVEDHGRTKCDFTCGTFETHALVSYVDSTPVENNELFSGEYVCSCVGVQ